ncbi:MAG: hypothetical protein WCZ10_14530 [Desulfobulbaceae bacterium]
MEKTTENSPQDDSLEQILIDALRDNFTPEAIAAIAADLTPDTKDPAVNRQVTWFRTLLESMLGSEGFAQALQEIGY